jgi:hypothetical protein
MLTSIFLRHGIRCRHLASGAFGRLGRPGAFSTKKLRQQTAKLHLVSRDGGIRAGENCLQQRGNCRHCPWTKDRCACQGARNIRCRKWPSPFQSRLPPADASVRPFQRWRFLAPAMHGLPPNSYYRPWEGFERQGRRSRDCGRSYSVRHLRRLLPAVTGTACWTGTHAANRAAQTERKKGS